MEGTVLLSFDVEQDCPPYLDTWRGVEEGLPRLLNLLRRLGIRATFFFTGEAVERYPELAARVVGEGHELGVHGYRHERLDRLPLDTACNTVTKAVETVEATIGVKARGFRAPNLQLPDQLFECLTSLGIDYDSSRALYKPPFQGSPYITKAGIVEIPVTITSSALRLPFTLQRLVLRLLARRRLLVLFSHPWEYVDMSREPIRWDCRFNTGERALQLLEQLILFLQSNGYRFATLGEYAQRIREKLRV